MSVFKFLIFVVFLSTLMVASGCKSKKQTNSTSPTSSNSTGNTGNSNTVTQYPNDLQMASEIRTAVNNHRSSLGLNTLTNYQIATNHAIRHTNYMISKNRISHDYFLSRSDDLKSKGAIDVSENVANGYPTAQDVLNGWLQSTTHKAAIENPNFIRTGIAAIKNPNGIYYYTQLFLEY